MLNYMKISNNLIQALGVNNKPTSKKQVAGGEKTNGAQNFDKITINKPGAALSTTSSFAASLSAKLSNELKAGAENQKLEAIKQDIKSGSYSVNSTEIARKMTIGL